MLKDYRKAGFAFLLLAGLLSTACTAIYTKSEKAALPATMEPSSEWRTTSTSGVTGIRQPMMDAPKWSSETALNLRDDATGLLWHKPLVAPAGDVSLEGAQRYCQSLGAPYMSVPTRQQLQTLVNYKYSNPVSAPDGLAGIRAVPYWTVTPSDINGADKTSYWLIDFLDGRSFSRSTKGNQAGVLCVSDFSESKPDTHYTDKGRWVEDNATGLGWQKQTVQAGDADALADACLASGLAGKRWRVPTQHELLSLVNAGQSRPYLDPLFSGELFLSSSTAGLSGVGADFYGVNFQLGVTVKGDGMHTRCVSQWPDNKMAGRTYEGNVYIDATNIDDANRQLQLFETGHYKKIHGDLYVHGSVAAVILPYLQEVTGSVGIDRNAKIHTVALPFLATIGGDLAVTGNALVSRLVFPGLSEIKGNLALERNDSLGSTQTAPPLQIEDSVQPLDLRALGSVGGSLTVLVNRQIKALAITSPTSVGKSVLIQDNLQLREVRFTSLRSIGAACRSGESDCGSLEILSNMRLKSLDAASLLTIGSVFSLRGNPELTGIQEKINRINGGMFGQYNRSLCARKVLDRILLRVWDNGFFPAAIDITDNDPSPGCKTECRDREHCTIPHALISGRR